MRRLPGLTMAIANGASASLAFTSPPGTTIADFTINREHGYPANDAHLTRRVTRLRQIGALAGYARDARTMTIRVGCYRRASNCSAPAGGRVYHVLYGADVTVNDPVPPVPTVNAEGLLAGGSRHGTDPVVMSATDNAGIRRVELLDVTAGRAGAGRRAQRPLRRAARAAVPEPRPHADPAHGA